LKSEEGNGIGFLCLEEKDPFMKLIVNVLCCTIYQELNNFATKRNGLVCMFPDRFSTKHGNNLDDFLTKTN
jgi:hypothetical protein